MADLHASFLVTIPLIEQAVTMALAERPDVICVTGDFITDRQDIDTAGYIRVLRRLSSAAPTFAVLGNHDGGKWSGQRWGYSNHKVVERILEESGIELLHNRPVRVEVGERGLALTGVADLWSDEIDAGRAFAGLQGEPIVLLAHNPDTKDLLRRRPWDLMLSGHTHGGQVILPLSGYDYIPVVDKRYVSGLKAWGTRQVHVTRGVGSYGGVRFRCRPEVSLLELV
jgi:predicted MPP superfamily phosphohydrolase